VGDTGSIRQKEMDDVVRFLKRDVFVEDLKTATTIREYSPYGLEMRSAGKVENIQTIVFLLAWGIERVYRGQVSEQWTSSPSLSE